MFTNFYLLKNEIFIDLFIVALNAVECPQNKLVISYVTTAINTHPLVSLIFFSCS